MLTRGLGRVGIYWKIGIEIYTLPYIKEITNKNLLYSKGNSTQYSIMTYIKKFWINKSKTENLITTKEKNWYKNEVGNQSALN